MAYTGRRKLVNSSSFWTQTNALLRKNLTFQKQNKNTNIRLILFPVILCLLFYVAQYYVDKLIPETEYKCSCACPNNKKTCNDSDKVCENMEACAVLRPQESPPLLQLPVVLCKKNGACPFNIIFTADNQSFAQTVSDNMFPSALIMNGSEIVLGSQPSEDNNVPELPLKKNKKINFEPALLSMPGLPNFYLQTQCPQNNSGFSFPNQIGISCGQVINLWRNSSSDINNELYKGQVNGMVSAFDFLNSNEDGFNIALWYNSTQKNGVEKSEINPRFVNLISNAYLQFLRGPGTKMLFEFVKEMPKPETVIKFGGIDVASFLGILFFTWVVLQLFPVVLTSLVYEKEQKLRIMMKMHGLGDGPYWLISYGYFLALSAIYMLCFVIFGSILGLKYFSWNDYSIQFLFYFIYINLQISMAFLLSSFLSNVKTATVIAYLGVFATGLLGAYLFKPFLESTFPRGWIISMELYPGFALYRGLYEFGRSSFTGSGMQWQDLSDSDSGMKEVLIIMSAEWVILIFVAYYIDQVNSTGNGKSPCFFLKGFKKQPASLKNLSIQRQGSKALAQMEKVDVIQEREKVEQLLLEPTINHAIVCDDLKKFYPGRDGNPGKFAVKELFLAVPRGECFGMLGPNGAGKRSFISMMIGLTEPTSGAAYVQGQDIRTHMDGIYTNMGVCPQHDLLWESLTGREHLLFYGRLKNLQGSALTQAVEESLKVLNLFYGGVADKQAGKYSGGMKRRLSVAISLIGDPKVVYMDEPSTGLDPASRNCLWNAIRLAKQDHAIILTTHSMEEAEALCDRLGIFVDGRLQCVGNPKELKGRYGGTYVLTMTTSSNHEKDVENMVQRLTPNANKIYHLSGTQKFELPKEDVKIANVFQAVEVAKRNFTVFAWGLADTTLEDVFIKVAREAHAFDTLS